MAKEEMYDIAIIGGGINGVGIAADAALRGLRVLLLERGDLGSGTSSTSSKLIHGGLRYLENHEFRLVRESLTERQVLLQNAKHLVKPLNFILPHHSNARPRLVIRLGLFLYDHLSWRSTLPKTLSLNLTNHPAGRVLKTQYQHAFQYTDCRTDDSRLVITVALQAKNNGADIYNYTECIKASRSDNHWQLTALNKESGVEYVVNSKILINATGPWAQAFLEQKAGLKSRFEMSPVKGSHIVVPRLYAEDFAFLLQNDDNRVVFIIPYLSDFHLIGTTDEPCLLSAGNPSISPEEIDYLLRTVNLYLATPLTKAHVIHSFSGVRPLVKDKSSNLSAMTRDYSIDIEQNGPPIISLFGGKLTTYRKAAEKVVDTLQPFFKNLGPSRTKNIPLPGGDYQDDNSLLKLIAKKYPWLSRDLQVRYLNQYGTNVNSLLDNCISKSNLGQHFGAGLYQREIDYLIKNEWVQHGEDLLWRRTKLGYFFSSNSKLDDYIKAVKNESYSIF